MSSQTLGDFVFFFDGAVVFRSALERGFRISGCNITELNVNKMTVCFNDNILNMSLADHCLLHIEGNVVSSLRVGSGSVFSNHASIVKTKSGNVTQQPPMQPAILTPLSSASDEHLPPPAYLASTSSIQEFISAPQIIVNCDVLNATCVASQIRVLGSICNVVANHTSVSVAGSSSIIETEDAYVTVNSASTVRSETGNIVMNVVKSAYSAQGIVSVVNDQVDTVVDVSENTRRKRFCPSSSSSANLSPNSF